MGSKERRKGAVGEREVANLFRAAGIPCERTPNSGGLHIVGDITGVDGFHLECKRQERLSIPAWCRQAEDDCPEGSVPVVIYRSSNQPWRVIVPLEWFIGVQAL